MRTSGKLRVLAAAALVATGLVLVLGPSAPVSAASITVNTNLDPAPNAQGNFPTDGKCSLRAAIEAAQNNSNATDVDCSTGAPVPNVLDTVQIDPSLAGQTLTLSYKIGAAVQPFDPIYGSAGDANALKIIGPTTTASDFKISGGNAVRPFLVGFLQSAKGDLTLANLTVQGGNGANGSAGAPAVSGQGGALNASFGSHLTFDNAVFTGNSAVKGGAVYAEGPTITNNGGAYTSNSASDDGGAVYLNDGPSVLNGYAVLFASNTAADKGGAIATNPGNVNPLVHLERSLVRNNSTTTPGNGGVLYVEPVGAPSAKTFEFYDSTAYQNSSLFFSTATSQKFDFQRDTIKDSGNLWGGTGGGDINNSIVTGANTCTYSINVINFNGDRNAMDPFVQAGDCGLNRFGPIGKITNMSASLAQNGGPEVQQTFALSAGSNAIDNGAKAFCGTIDARSVPRGIDGNGIVNNPQTGDCDIGAYEYAKFVVNFVTGTSSANEGGGVKNVQVKLRILDPGTPSLPAPLSIPVTYDNTSTATKTIDFNSPASVTFPTGSVDGAIANYPVTILQDNVAELFGEEAHFTLGSASGVAVAEPKDHTLSIQDDDQAGAKVDDGGDGTHVAEATPTVGEAINFSLQSQPDRALLNPAAPGDPASYGPPANVDVTVTPDRDCTATSGATVGSQASPLHFTILNADWQTAHPLTIKAINDLYDEDFRDETVPHTRQLRYTFSSQDPIYNATQDAYEATIADNDVAGVKLVRTAGPDPLRENTADAATYKLSLTSAPDPGKPLPNPARGPVTVQLTPSAGCDVGAGSGVAKGFDFTEANWNQPVTVTVKPVDNLVVELSHQCTVTSKVFSDDPVYADLSAPPAFAGTPPGASENVQDYDPPAGNTDDPPFAIVTTSGGDGAEVDEGPPATFDKVNVVLQRAPKGADVTFKLFANDDPLIAGPQVTVAKPGDVPGQSASITFTPANWNIPQVMEIHAVDDDYDEADIHPWSVIASMDSTAPGFSNPLLRGIELDGTRTVGNVNIPVAITDNDTSAFDIRDTGADTTVKEGSNGDQVDVRLGTHPYSDVDVTVTPDAQCTVAGAASTVVHIKAAEWNQAHLVDVDAVDDDVLEGPHHCVLTFDAASDDSLYDQLAPATKTIDVIDNEVAEIDATTGNGIAVTEGGATDTFDLVLKAKPASDVTITVGHDGQTSSAASKVFTPANWDVPQTVTVSAIDDAIAEGAHSGTITLGITTAAPGYDTAPIFKVDGVATTTITAAITDNDTAGVTASKTSLTLTESGPADTYTVKLSSQPIDDVTITLAATGLRPALPGDLSFNPANWNVAQTVTVTPGNDDVVHAQSCTIHHQSNSADPNYTNLNLPITDATGAVADDDVAAVTPSKTILTLTEAGADDTYTLVLGSKPTADVKVDLAATGLCSVLPASMTFTPANWSTAQTATVTPGNDNISHVQTCTVGHTITSADPAYAALSVPDVSGDVADDDTPGIVQSKTALTLVESGAADTYTMRLGSKPTADVTIGLSASGLCGVGPASLTFTPANFGSAQTVTVTPGDDDIVHAQSCTITHTVNTADVDYAVLTVPDATGPVVDDDVAAVKTSKSTLTLTESGAADTYTVVLGSQPTADVHVALAATGLCTRSPSSLTFTSANWNVAQDVTVTPGNDDVVHPQSCSIGHTVTSADGTYDGVDVAAVTGTVTDDDTAGILASKTNLTLTESGSADTYTLVLTSQPSADVTVTLGTTGLCGVMPLPLTFTAANWDVAQNVAVLPGNDDIVHAQSCTVTHTVTSADPVYDGFALANATGAVADDDVAAVHLSKAALTLAESGAADTYTVVLTSQPASDVTIAVGAAGLCSALPASLTFTAANWSTAQTVTVTPGNDDIVHAQSCTVTHTVTSGDANYSGIAVASATGAVADDDTASIDPSKSSLTLAESGAADTYTLVLGSQPTADVKIDLAASGLCSVLPASVTFTAANWSTAQTVTVTPGNDDVVHAQSCTVTHTVTSTDPAYSSITVPDATGAVADDDTPSITPSTSSLTLAESGAADTYTVVLGSKPTADVTVGLSAAGLCSVQPASLTFTPANYASAQLVTVTPGNDDIVHAQSCTISHTVSSTDANYSPLTVPDATGSVTDDDSAVVHTSKAALTLAEAGAADTYTVVLTSQPVADVHVALAATGLCSVQPASLTFTSANWSTAQTVTVTPGNDNLVHAQSCAIAHTVTSADPAYDGANPGDVIGAVTDDDTAGIIASKTNLSLSESGLADTYTLVLTSQPTANVLS